MLTRDESLRYCSAPCASGKTHNIIRRACQMIKSGSRVVIAQPTKDLIEKTVRDEFTNRPGQPDYKIFHGDRIPPGSSVARELVAYLKCDPAPLVFITHPVLHTMPYWHDQKGWDLIIDEELTVYRYFSHRVPETHRLLTEHLRIEPLGPTYGRVHVNDFSGLEKKSRNRRGDEILEQVIETSRILGNDHFQTFVNTEHYGSLLEGKREKLTFYSILQPSVVKGFRSVFMAAANFTDTAVYRLWSKQNIEFQEDHDFAKALRYSVHLNGDLATIYYFFECLWSRKCCDAIIEETTKATTLQRMIDGVAALFGQDRFLFQMNKRFQTSPFGSNATRLPGKPHGLNIYSDVHDISFFSSLNPSSDQFGFLQSRGLSSDEVRTITYHSPAYQAIMRTSLRNLDDTNPKRIIVPDRGAAEYLQKLLPGSRIERLDIGLPADHCCPKESGRPRKHTSDRERVAAHRQKQREKRMQMLEELINLTAQYDTGKGSWEGCCNEISNEPYTGFVTTRPFAGTIYGHKKATEPAGYLPWNNDESFIDFLLGCHSRQIASKENAFLISPAIFDPSRSNKTSRGYENIVYLRHLWLDFEDGDLTHQQLGDLFPDIRMLAMNSYHHKPEKPRFRVVILTTDVITPDVYKLLVDNFVKKLEDAGYWTQRKKDTEAPASMLRSGLDWSKRPPTSLFYLPCQAKNPKHSFIGLCNPSGQALNAAQWVEHSAVEPWVEFSPRRTDDFNSRRPVNQEKVQAAIMEWHTSKADPGKGNQMFFNLALSLRSAGMSLDEIKQTLRDEAKYGRSPSKRKAQIPSIMATLRRSRR
jgi:hypothetical protein